MKKTLAIQQSLSLPLEKFEQRSRWRQGAWAASKTILERRVLRKGAEAADVTHPHEVNATRWVCGRVVRTAHTAVGRSKQRRLFVCGTHRVLAISDAHSHHMRRMALTM